MSIFEYSLLIFYFNRFWHEFVYILFEQIGSKNTREGVESLAYSCWILFS